MSFKSWKRKVSACAVSIAVAGFGILGTTVYSIAADYPTKPVTIILPYGPGGVADISMRLIAEQLSAKLGQQFIVENKPGGGGILGTQTALNSAPDGYTLMLLGNGQAIAKPLFSQLPFDPEADIQPISMIAEFGLVMFTAADSKFKSVADVQEYATANLGKLNIGTISTGSTQNLAAELFMSVAGLDASLIPFKATPDLITAIIRGDVDVGFDIFAGLKGVLDAKQVLPLATTASTRATILPDTQTVEEAGITPFLVTSWNALAGPAGIPEEVVQTLNAAIAEALTDPAIQTRMMEFGMEPRGSTPGDLAARLSADIKKWEQVINEAGVPKQ